MTAASRPMHNPALPAAELLAEQADWLAPARTWLLRRASIAQRRRVLDLGCGYGAITDDLVRRAGGQVVALDLVFSALNDAPHAFAGAHRVCGDAAHLPFPDKAFDLVFCQFALLWMPVPTTLVEIRRVLQPDGVLIAIEPDYGGMMEHPATIAMRDLWLAGLERAGANVLVGRMLPSLLSALGLQARVEFLSELVPPSPLRFELLRDLPLTDQEQQALARAEAASAVLTDDWAQVAHLPLFLVTATKP